MDGNLYGTTQAGGVGSNCENGCGTVFRITPSGTLTTLHSFNVTDGVSPTAALVQGTDGDFYGPTPAGGPGEDGTIFKITPGGKLTTLYGFSMGGAMGDSVLSPLIQATDGNFYGAGANDGTDLDGMLFSITPEGGTLTTLYNFTGATDGLCPNGMFQATDGTLYGTTQGGRPCDSCDSSYGAVFSLDMGFGPFVSFVRASGHVGQTVEILDQGFTGATHVSFSGTSAPFTVQSDTYLTATIPAGATTGLFTVTESSGGLTSGKIFRVTPQIFSFSPRPAQPGPPWSSPAIVSGERPGSSSPAEMPRPSPWIPTHGSRPPCPQER
jgi:uncharacterized repeat protein (TIGR03803 family)